MMGGVRSCPQPCYLFVGVTCSEVIKVPWVYITAVMILETVQYSFCKSPLELVVVVSISILHFVFCDPVLWALHCVIISRDQFDILWHAMLGPI